MHPSKIKAFICVVSFLVTFTIKDALCLRTIDLNGHWAVSSKNVSVPGTVPGSMFTALMAAGVIGDPYFRRNDEVYAWVGDMDWNYTRSFQATADLMSNPTVVLVCEGLDTVATVTVNNVTVGKTDNMFIRYVFDVKSALKLGDNVITIAFRSATQYVKEMATSMPYAILPTCVPHQYHGACGANLIRKTQCSFSWDWGPAFPTQGIWKDIYIQGYQTAVIRDVTTETTSSDGSWRLKVDVFMEPTAGGPVQGQLEVKLDGTPIVSSKSVTLDHDHSKVSFDISIPKSVSINEWWPNGYGNQTLYELFVFYTDALGTMNTRKLKIGFRTVELVQDYVSVNKSLGRTFYFRINGRPVFLKGSNWIPADSFLERVTRDRIYTYLKSAADVHMNAMRVWGGGIYEFDMFYEIADELGIMIWQDFMFACAMYPANDAFLASVRIEATQQVRRLKHHPSIIALSGNNENEKALVQDWYGTDINYTRYKNDYLKLYVDTIRTVVLAEDNSRPFLSSSPSNGMETEEEGWIARKPYDTHYGDIHEYMYLVPFYDPKYGGKWKMLHYYAAHFFAPTLISPYVDGDVLDVYVIMDELSVKEVRDPLNSTAQSVFRRDVDVMVAESGCGRPRKCFLVFHLGNETSDLMSWLPLDTFSNADGLRKAIIRQTHSIAIELTGMLF
ncbi:MANBA-like protein [Mya arenaria]|uniref:beta-mannosidase n=1 Tax=Mya arenaria TaxID=6604 RepID=A0ABY7E738_MYAAR|nr:MANBA-like protein [Mya arenaria]